MPSSCLYGLPYANLCRKMLMQVSLQHIFLHKSRKTEQFYHIFSPRITAQPVLSPPLRFPKSLSPEQIPCSGPHPRSPPQIPIRQTAYHPEVQDRHHTGSLLPPAQAPSGSHFLRIRRCLSLRLCLSGSRFQSALIVVCDSLTLVRKTCVLRRRIRIREHI